MTSINPFTGAVMQSGQVQQHQSTEKQRQIRRTQNLSKNTALQGDRLEHQVESADALHPLNDQGNAYNPQRRPNPRPRPQKPRPEDGDEAAHIDLTA